MDIKQLLSSHKVRFFGVLGGLVLVVLLFSKTYVLDSFALSGQIDQVEEQISTLNHEISNVQKTKEYYSLESFNQKEALGFMNNKLADKNAEVNGIENQHFYHSGGQTVVTMPFKVKGALEYQLELLDALYYQYPIGIRSIVFETTKPSYNAKEELHTTLYLQTVAH